MRVIDAQGQMRGVMPTREAQRLADDLGLDLVEVSPNTDPPVCKIMDFGKFRYEESMKRKMERKNQSRQQVKEIKFHATVDTNDLEVKVRRIRQFIADGDKVKVSLQYRGRENAHKELGLEVIERVVKECEDVTIVEQAPKLIGRVVGCLLAPRPVGKGGTKKAANTSAAPKPQATDVSQVAPTAAPMNPTIAKALDALRK